eukprot:GEMP01012600.1.p1 GENE.GEMP01012600.1~~GEMP01012600.1.p1  ORF type:complete len:705 (+),score=124.98 GEMP01012600.1:248-2362(+)
MSYPQEQKARPITPLRNSDECDIPAITVTRSCSALDVETAHRAPKQQLQKSRTVSAISGGSSGSPRVAGMVDGISSPSTTNVKSPQSQRRPPPPPPGGTSAPPPPIPRSTVSPAPSQQGTTGVSSIGRTSCGGPVSLSIPMTVGSGTTGHPAHSSGEMWKLSDSVFNVKWHKRYFVLHGATLQYFKGPSDKEVRETLSMEGASITIMNEYYGKQNVLSLTFPSNAIYANRTYYVTGLNYDETVQWMKRFEGAVGFATLCRQGSLRSLSTEASLSPASSDAPQRKLSIFATDTNDLKLMCDVKKFCLATVEKEDLSDFATWSLVGLENGLMIYVRGKKKWNDWYLILLIVAYLLSWLLLALTIGGLYYLATRSNAAMAKTKCPTDLKGRIVEILRHDLAARHWRRGESCQDAFGLDRSVHVVGNETRVVFTTSGKMTGIEMFTVTEDQICYLCTLDLPERSLLERVRDLAGLRDFAQSKDSDLFAKCKAEVVTIPQRILQMNRGMMQDARWSILSAWFYGHNTIELPKGPNIIEEFDFHGGTLMEVVSTMVGSAHLASLLPWTEILRDPTQYVKKNGDYWLINKDNISAALVPRVSVSLHKFGIRLGFDGEVVVRSDDAEMMPCTFTLPDIIFSDTWELCGSQFFTGPTDTGAPGYATLIWKGLDVRGELRWIENGRLRRSKIYGNVLQGLVIGDRAQWRCDIRW